MADRSLIPDPWTRLRAHTSARIALGRAGGSLPTSEVLKFAADHAAARDAVAAELDFDDLEKALLPLGLPIVRVASQAPDRSTYLHRPDLGRRLDSSSVKTLTKVPHTSEPDLVLIVADGLSALAARKQSPPLLESLVPMLRNESRLTLAPLILARHARVALQDEIGAILGARCAVILIGERPGLGSPDSLGAYLVFAPRIGNTDALRNCVSNIRPAGLPHSDAARTIHHLVVESLRRRISGVGLKDERLLTDAS